MTSIDTPHNPLAIAPHKAWQVALGELQLQVTSDIYEMYLHPTRYLAYEDGTFLVTVPNGFVKEWLELRLNRVVKRTLRHIVSREVEVKYSVQPTPPREPVQMAEVPLLSWNEQHSEGTAEASGSAEGLPLVAEYTFANYVIGANNRMAHAAAFAVADQPGDRYNPLFIYSGVGLGKTHLMHAIGHRARQRGFKAVYVSCEMFTNELVTAIRTNTQEQFRAKYRTSDLLLVDDIQFLAGKPSTQEEFFHTFNALYEAGRQVVLACDRPPQAMAALESRLRSRFAWGLIMDIQPPDLETRLAILQAKASASGSTIANAVLERIAQLVPTNVRELEGALTKVMAHASLNGASLLPSDVEVTLADMMPVKAQLEPEIVLALVAREFGVTQEELTSGSRKRAILTSRQVAMYLLREELGLPFSRIGRLFGGRDHATAIHSVRKIADLVESDDAFRRQVDRLKGAMISDSLRQPVRVR